MKKTFLSLLTLVILTSCTLVSAETLEPWTCINGHEGNTGNFCTECGAVRPEEPEPWTCENGHEGNTGNFCTECGAPKPPEVWTCENGHEGNTGNFCTECGAPRTSVNAGTAAQNTSVETVQETTTAEPEVFPETPVSETAVPETAAPETALQTEAVTYDNPLPEEISRFTTPFTGMLIDHQIAISEVLSHMDPSDDFYLAYEGRGTASEKIAWEKYSGPNQSMYLVYQNKGKEVYAYVYTFELDESQRVPWAEGSLMPNLIGAISPVLWVESGEDNDVYSQMMDEASADSDYEGVQGLLRSLDPAEDARWFSHQLCMFRDEPGGMDRYWLVFHNTGA